MSPSKHAPRASAEAARPAAVSSLQASLITDTTLDLDDGLVQRMEGPSQFERESDGSFLNKLSAFSSQLDKAQKGEGQKAEEKKGSRHCHWLSYFKLHTSNFSVAPGSALKTGCHCEFTAPEGTYVRKKQKLIFGPKKRCFLGGGTTWQSSIVNSFVQATILLFVYYCRSHQLLHL